MPQSVRFFARLMFQLIGEPQIGAWTPDELAADLRAAGFVVHEDCSMVDWNGRFADVRANVERASYMRIAVAEARAVSSSLSGARASEYE